MVGDVLHAAEGPTAVFCCVNEPIDSPCPRSEDCIAQDLWIELCSRIGRRLNAVTLAELAAETDKQADS